MDWLGPHYSENGKKRSISKGNRLIGILRAGPEAKGAHENKKS